MNLIFMHTPTAIFRYPAGTAREAARAGEIYQRTLELVEEKVGRALVCTKLPSVLLHLQVRAGGRYNLSTHSPSLQAGLVSPANLELITQLSGCEGVRDWSGAGECEDLCHHQRYRSLTGGCNNHQQPLWGAALTPFTRLLPPRYTNGFNSPAGADRPGARQVSRLVVAGAGWQPDPAYTAMLMQWGQFLDHDLSHSMEAVSRESFSTGRGCGAGCSREPPCLPIPLEEGDPRLARAVQPCIEFTRSAPSCGSGATSVFYQRLQQREQVTTSVSGRHSFFVISHKLTTRSTD